MKVKELIQKLKKFDGETDIILEHEKGVGWFDIDVVEEVHPDGVKEKTVINIGHID